MLFWAVVVMPSETADLRETVARLLAPYDLALPAPPTKKYLSARALAYHAESLGVSPSDLSTLAARINEHYTETLHQTTHFQADALGIYVVSEQNPVGKYKRWSLNSLEEDVWSVSAMPRDLMPHAVITPDGAWHELFPNIWGKMPKPPERERITREAYALIDQHPGDLAARLECHF